MAAVVFAVKITSKSSGLALKKWRTRRRQSSIRREDNWDDVEAECGFPNKFDVMTFEKSSIRLFGYGVVPA